MERNKLSIKDRLLVNVWEKDLTIALDILRIKEKGICPAYISKINVNCEKQIILLMIPNEEKEGWHYLTVKKYLHYCIV